MAMLESSPVTGLLKVEELTEEDRRRTLTFLNAEEQAARVAGWPHYADMLKRLQEHVVRQTSAPTGA